MRRRASIKLILPMLLVATVAVAAYAAGRADSPTNLARYLSSYALTAKPEWFGGFSALSLSPDGSRVTVITDRSHLVEGDVERQDGKIHGVTFDVHEHLRDYRGKVLLGGKAFVDSEGMARARDGTVYVSFEGRARVSHFSAYDAAENELPRPEAFDSFAENKSLEALAIDGQGRLYTLTEDNGRNHTPVWRWDGQNWDTPFSIEKRDSYLQVGLDVGPDGRFYLLERKFVWIGFRSRLRRWDMTADGLANETLLFSSTIGAHDNLEGLSVWRAENGELRATMVSDNNFMPFQRSELVEYHLPD